MPHPVVSPDQWLAARAALLKKEKEFTKARDALSRERRALPWEKVEKSYVFDGPNGPESLGDLFAGKSQLVVYHFMFNPTDDAGCPSCSFWADHYDGMTVHLGQRDVSFVVISRAPLAKIAAFQQRMGWKFKWLSSGNNSFNYDYRVSFTPSDSEKPVYNVGTLVPGMPDREGLSVFTKDSTGAVFRTYSTFARGIDMINGTYQILDLVPKGRDEDPEATQDWVRHHDRYDR